MSFAEIVETPTARLLVNKNDRYIGASLLTYQEFSVYEGDFLDSLIGPGNIVVEVGANIGAHTVHMAQKVGKDGRIIAFEPQRLVFQMLCANVALNSLSNVDAHWAAVSESHLHINVPELDPEIPENFGGLHILDSYDKTTRVQCYRLDGLCNLPSLQLLKIDVEGMEQDVIDSGRALINKHRPFMYVENDRPDNSKALLKTLHGLGYKMYWHIPMLFRPNNVAGKEEDIFSGIGSFNLFCIPEEVEIGVSLEEITDFDFHPLKHWEVA